MTLLYYVKASGQYVGAASIPDYMDPEKTPNPHRDAGYIEVSEHAPSSEWFWDFAGAKWYLPPPTEEQAADAANMLRDSLLVEAALRIAPLQDAADLDVATADDAANLTRWKQYRVSLNRISDQPGFPFVIDWPGLPI